MRRLIAAAAVILAVVLVLFDVDVNPEFALPREVSVPDPQQERRFEACVEREDEIIHRETFDRIDNPDVQREVLAARKEQAKARCRSQFPVRMTTRREPLRANLLDFRFRY